MRRRADDSGPMTRPDASPDDRPTPVTLTAERLAERSGTTAQRIRELTRRGVLLAAGDGQYVAGDIHRVRAVDAFEAAGIPLDALVAASEAGRVSFAYYDELHLEPGVPSERTVAEFASSLGPLAQHLPRLYDAFGLPAPTERSRLAVDDERFITELLEAFDATGRPEIAIRVARLFAEALRRASESVLGVYRDVVQELDPAMAGLPPDEEYQRLFVPWSRIARLTPRMAHWLAARHMSRAIDAYSVSATEQILEAHGYVQDRPAAPPGLAFVDLTGFSRLSEERGDEVAAGIALELGELARAAAAAHGGRVVKLLGDGVLLRLPGGVAAADAAIALLEALEENDLPAGHAGVHAGTLIEREGDVFGRAVNLAARVSDVALPGQVLVTEAVATELAEVSRPVERLPARSLQGIGETTLFRVVSRPR